MSFKDNVFKIVFVTKFMFYMSLNYAIKRIPKSIYKYLYFVFFCIVVKGIILTLKQRVDFEINKSVNIKPLLNSL